MWFNIPTCSNNLSKKCIPLFSFFLSFFLSFLYSSSSESILYSLFVRPIVVHVLIYLLLLFSLSRALLNVHFFEFFVAPTFASGPFWPAFSWPNLGEMIKKITKDLLNSGKRKKGSTFHHFHSNSMMMMMMGFSSSPSPLCVLLFLLVCCMTVFGQQITSLPGISNVSFKQYLHF